MVCKSWPTMKPRRRRTQRWHSCPTVYHLEKEKHGLPRLRKKRQPKRSTSGSDPVPGPSGILLKSATSGSSLDCGPSHGRVKITKRKGMSEMEQGSPCKKSRSTSPRRKTKARRTPLDKDLRKRPNAVSRLNEEKDGCPEGTLEEGFGSSSGGYEQRCLPLSPDYEFSHKVVPIESAQFNQKYTFGELRGAGCYGEVYCGVRIQDNFPVAIKRVRNGMNDKIFELLIDGEVRRVPHEVAMLIEVGAGPGSASSSITPLLLDWYEQKDELILVLERPEPCMDLDEYLRLQNPAGLDEMEVKIIFRQLVEAAIEMQARGVYHGDIKTDNILIETGRDVPKARFIDFGFANVFKPEEHIKDAIGTPAYASPEFFRESVCLADSSTAWQLGVVLFIMLCDRMPLKSEHSIGSMRAVPIPSEFSQECRNFLKGCLGKDPEMRLTLQNLRDHPWLNSE